MATILTNEQQADGWQVRVQLTTGKVVSWHFPPFREPTQALIDKIEIEQMLVAIQEYEAGQ
jgi:hypothetical protein